MVTKKFLKAKFDCTTDKNPEGLHGRTALHFAAKYGHLDICQLIINNTSDKNPKDDYGTTPLSFADEEGHKSVVKLLKSFDNYVQPSKQKRRN